jgi:hypothetical protein
VSSPTVCDRERVRQGDLDLPSHYLALSESLLVTIRVLICHYPRYHRRPSSRRVQPGLHGLSVHRIRVSGPSFRVKFPGHAPLAAYLYQAASARRSRADGHLAADRRAARLALTRPAPGTGLRAGRPAGWQRANGCNVARESDVDLQDPSPNQNLNISKLLPRLSPCIALRFKFPRPQ